MVILPPPPMFSAESVADALKPVIAASRDDARPVLAGGTMPLEVLAQVVDDWVAGLQKAPTAG